MNPYFMRLHGMLAFPQKHRFQKILCPGATLFSLFQCKKGKLTYPLLPPISPTSPPHVAAYFAAHLRNNRAGPGASIYKGFSGEGHRIPTQKQQR